MFIKQAYKGLHEWWRWLLGLLIIGIAWQFIGAIPFGVAVAIKLMAGGDIDAQMDATSMMNILSSNTTLFLMLLPFAFGMIGWYLWVKYSHNLKIKLALTTRSSFDYKRLFLAFSIVAIFQIIMLGLGLWLSPETLQWNFRPEPFFTLVAIAIILIPVQTLFEEFFFRSYMTQGFGVMFNSKLAALLIPTILFGAMHLFNPEIAKLGYGIAPFYFATGLLLGICTLMDEGIELAGGFHIANNLMIALLVTSDWGALQTESLYIDTAEPTLTWHMAVPLLILYPLLLFIFAKVYNWSDWSNKLTGSVQSSNQHFPHDTGHTS